MYWSIYREDEELAKRFIFESAGCECHQQNLREIHQEWEGAKDRARALLETGYSMLIQVVLDMPVNRAS